MYAADEYSDAELPFDQRDARSQTQTPRYRSQIEIIMAILIAQINALSFTKR